MVRTETRIAADYFICGGKEKREGEAGCVRRVQRNWERRTAKDTESTEERKERAKPEKEARGRD
jgi:hypothetical protein